MMISTKGRYALTTLIDIAENSDGRTPVSIKEISERRGISLKYLEQIIALMVKGGFLRSVRGARGGYLFTRLGDRCRRYSECGGGHTRPGGMPDGRKEL